MFSPLINLLRHLSSRYINAADLHESTNKHQRKGIYMKLSGLLLAAATLVSLNASANLCAEAYRGHGRFGADVLTLNAGDAISNLNQTAAGDWDNQITAVVVQPGCTVLGYQYQDYNIDYRTNRRLAGFVLVSENNRTSRARTEVLNSYYTEKVSSLKCFCK